MFMRDIACYERLLGAVALIVHHPPFPEKSAAIERCAGEIEEMVRSGGLTGVQGGTLLDILAGDDPRSRRVAPLGFGEPGAPSSRGATPIGIRPGAAAGGAA
jgi:hypothetical protein